MLLRKLHTTPELLLPFARVFVTRRCAAALAFPLLLVDEKELAYGGGCLTNLLKKDLPRLTCTTCMVSEQSKFLGAQLALPTYSPRQHQVRRVLLALERRFKMILGGSLCESFTVLTAPSHALIKTGKARAGPVLLV